MNALEIGGDFLHGISFHTSHQTRLNVAGNFLSPHPKGGPRGENIFHGDMDQKVAGHVHTCLMAHLKAYSMTMKKITSNNPSFHIRSSVMVFGDGYYIKEDVGSKGMCPCCS